MAYILCYRDGLNFIHYIFLCIKTFRYLCDIFRVYLVLSVYICVFEVIHDIFQVKPLEVVLICRFVA